ncbi:MAG TPA: O-antigen ligase family protein [Opitutaceae bacterium]|nr:O-antigen ligase family protein [Opitutaceae bacterium]
MNPSSSSDPRSGQSRSDSSASGRRHSREGRSGSRRPLETATFAHIAGLLVLTTWFFGGGSDAARWWISLWGSLGIAITLTAWVTQRRANDGSLRPLRWAWPVAAFNVLVLASCLNPSFSEKFLAGESLLAHTGAASSKLPSTVHARTSLQHLWLFDALYFSALNLVLVVRQRRILRGLLLFAAANGVVLAVFGTLQKLMSDGLFFGAVKSPNPRFFASFVYANHWAALTVLLVAGAGGLVFHYSKRDDGTPASRARILWGVASLLLIGITPLIAGSRAGTLLMLALFVTYGVRTLWRIWNKRRAMGELAFLPLAGLLLCAVVGVGSSVWLGRSALRERWIDTQDQWRAGPVSGRAALYRDTWRLAKDEPVFGWGLGNYGKAFMLIRPRPLETNRQYERSYMDAHSDWLQAVAEVGFVGTLLLGLSGALPLLSLRKRQLQSTVSSYALFGCGLVLVYATIEFPFANPAVVFAWWMCFFCAVQHARLQAPPPPKPSRSSSSIRPATA